FVAVQQPLAGGTLAKFPRNGALHEQSPCKLSNPAAATPRVRARGARMSLYVGLDVGTQSVKLVAYDPEARQVSATIGHALELAAGDDGSREQRAEWWIEAIRSCFARLDPALRERVV